MLVTSTGDSDSREVGCWIQSRGSVQPPVVLFVLQKGQGYYIMFYAPELKSSSFNLSSNRDLFGTAIN